MSGIRQPLLEDPADLFVQLYDSLDEEPFRSGRADTWLSEPRVAAIAEGAEERLVADGQLDIEEVAESIEIAEDESERIFAFLLGIDRALMYVHPHTATADQAALIGLALRYAETGRLNTHETSGALVPRFAFPGREQVGFETRRDAFSAVIRIDSSAWGHIDHAVVPNRFDFGRRDRERGVVVACVPMLDTADDLEWTTGTDARGSWYRISARSSAEMEKRVERVLWTLDDQGVQLAVLPELAITDELLAVWRRTIREHPPTRHSLLKWILLGTGPVGAGDPPPNRAVVMERRSGEILLTQDKLFPFDMSAGQVTEWGLEERLGSGPLREDILRGEHITMVESRLGRVGVLICEDLGRLEDLLTTLVDHGITHVMAPVFSSPTLPWHWEHRNAKVYADAAGAQVIVSNSLVVARQMPNPPERPGTALASTPDGHEVGWSEDAEQISQFQISAGRPPLVVGRRL